MGADCSDAEFEGGLSLRTFSASEHLSSPLKDGLWVALLNGIPTYMRMTRVTTQVARLLLMLVPITQASAQIAPSVDEIQDYRGLHAAAARGDIAEIERLVKTGAAIEA